MARENYEFMITYRTRDDLFCEDWFSTDRQARDFASYLFQVDETKFGTASLYRDIEDTGHYTFVTQLTKVNV